MYRPICWQVNLFHVWYRALNVLNHVGVCTSYSTTWNYLRRLVEESRIQEVVRQGHWIWVYDNLNKHQTVRHDCLYWLTVCKLRMIIKSTIILHVLSHSLDVHNRMMNVTARHAVKIPNLPGWEVDWSDKSPQQSPPSLDVWSFSTQSGRCHTAAEKSHPVHEKLPHVSFFISKGTQAVCITIHNSTHCQ